MRELKRYLSYIGKYKVPYWSIFIGTLVTSVMLTLIYPYMNKLMFNALEYGDKDLWKRAAALCIVLVVLNCLAPYRRYFQIRVVRKIVFDIKLGLFEKLMKLDMEYYESHHSGGGAENLELGRQFAEGFLFFTHLLGCRQTGKRRDFNDCDACVQPFAGPGVDRLLHGDGVCFRSD